MSSKLTENAPMQSDTLRSTDEAMITVEGVTLRYSKDHPPVLSSVSLAARSHEFLSITGPSGCGKTSLLRIMAGLTKPSTGSVTFRGTTYTKPPEGITMVFQNFVLLPWRTTLENVVFALAPMHDLNEAEKRDRALKVLENVGLMGYENVYPGDLSGGMKQRVGIARALALEPKVILMDEPFSALDDMTAENLRREIHSLIMTPSSPVQTVVMVSHNIEEIVELSDRVIVLSPRTGNVVGEVKIDLPRLRSRKSVGFQQFVDQLYSLLA